MSAQDYIDKWVEVGSEFPVTCLGKKFYGKVIAIDNGGVDIRLDMPVFTLEIEE